MTKPATIHDIFYLHITEQTSMGAMTIFACRERDENEVLTKQVAELHLSRVEFQLCRNFDPSIVVVVVDAVKREPTSPPPSSGWLSASSLFRNFHPVKRHSRAFRNSWRPDEISTSPSSRIQLAGHRRTSLYPRGGKGKGNLTSCLGAGK